jgi:hypothetical protein
MPHLKIINTIQGHIHRYEKLKRKLFNCNADTYFRVVLDYITYLTLKHVWNFSQWTLLYLLLEQQGLHVMVRVSDTHFASPALRSLFR